LCGTGLLKDGVELLLSAWRAVRERSVVSISQSIAGSAKAWTVKEWHHPYAAVREFGDRRWLQLREEGSKECGELLAEVQRAPPETRKETYPKYEGQLDEMKREGDAYTSILLEDLQEKLLRGQLIARGFGEPFLHGAPYLTISRHEWRIIELELPARAQGGGVSYVGLTIGKVGTKSFFRRG
jgi:hypothetical protein